MKKPKDLSKRLNTCLKIGEAREAVIEKAKEWREKHFCFILVAGEIPLVEAVNKLLKLEKAKEIVAQWNSLQYDLTELIAQALDTLEKETLRRAASEICPHEGAQKIVHRFCCEHAQKIRNLGRGE